MTTRLLRAMSYLYVDIIGHPTTRLIGNRPPIDADLARDLRGGGLNRHRAGKD